MVWHRLENSLFEPLFLKVRLKLAIARKKKSELCDEESRGLPLSVIICRGSKFGTTAETSFRDYSFSASLRVSPGRACPGGPSLQVRRRRRRRAMS